MGRVKRLGGNPPPHFGGEPWHGSCVIRARFTTIKIRVGYEREANPVDRAGEMRTPARHGCCTETARKPEGASALNPGFFPDTSRYSLDRICGSLLDGMCIPRAALSLKHIALRVNVCFREGA